MTSRVSAPPPHRVDLPVPQPNPALAPLARRAHSALLVGVLAVATAPVCAQNWTWGSAVTARETVTNNVKLQSDTRQSDWVTELTPSLHVNEKGARTTFAGTLSVPIVFYARNGGNNTAYPSADLLGDVRLIGEIFHVEGQASVAQQYFNPFGAQPLGFENVTQNRYRTSTYRISPYLKGVTPDLSLEHISLLPPIDFRLASGGRPNGPPLQKRRYDSHRSGACDRRLRF